MIKKKGLRLLLTFVFTIVTLLIANFIDGAFHTNGNLILSTLFAGVILIVFWLHKDMIEEEPFNVFVRFFKNVLLLILVGAFLIFIIFSALASFESIETDGRLIFTMLISTVLTFFLITFYHVIFTKETFWGVYPYFIFGITAVSFVLSLLTSLLGSRARIVSIVLIVIGVVLLIIAFAQNRLAFIAPRHAKVYMPSGQTDNEDKLKNEKTDNGGIRRVMLNVCSHGISASMWLPNSNYYSPRVNWRLDSENDDTVIVEVGGSIYIHDKQDVRNDYKDIAKTVDGYREEIKKRVKDNYHFYAEQAVKNGVDCRRIRYIKIKNGRITT